jgi:hypothetical protein
MRAASRPRRWSACAVFALVLAAAWLAPGFVGGGRAEAVVEGFGTTTPGGAGGSVYVVNSLGDSGPGTLRDAVSGSNRTIVFTVSGEIQLSGPIIVTGAFLTIDGFTAPSPGITLIGGGLIMRGMSGAHDIIVRGLRVRDVPFDCFQVSYGAYNIVIHNVSVSGASDGLIDITEGSHDVTVAWSILENSAKAMLIKYHPSRVTLHHNFFASGRNRNPQVGNDEDGTPATDTTVDMRNNLVWNWGGGVGTTIHHGAWGNVVANFYSSPGASDLDQEQAIVVCRGDCFDNDPVSVARAYTAANVSGDFYTPDINRAGTESVPFPAAPLAFDDACTAARDVLQHAGARPLDTIDAAHVASVSLGICRATVTALASSDPATLFGEPVTLTATVTPKPPASGAPAGTIAFRDGSTTLGTVPLVGGTATLTVATLRAARHVLTAVYSGDADFNGSVSGAFSQQVKAASTATTLTASPNPSRIKRPVTLSVAVATAPPVPIAPAGTVTFYDGSHLLGSVGLVGGLGSLTTSALPPGYRRLVARYSPAAGFLSSASAVVTAAIEGGTATTLSASPSQPRMGQPVTVKATVAPTAPGGGTPTGLVTFKRGSVSLGSAPVTGGVAQVITTPPGVGTYAITASYGGDSGFAASVAEKLRVQVAKGATTTTLTSSSSSVPHGQPVTFTAVVTAVAPAAGVPASTVKFRDGSTTLATVSLVNGRATFRTSALAVGTRTISAVYSGSSNYLASTSLSLPQQITP